MANNMRAPLPRVGPTPGNPATTGSLNQTQTDQLRAIIRQHLQPTLAKVPAGARQAVSDFWIAIRDCFIQMITAAGRVANLSNQARLDTGNSAAEAKVAIDWVIAEEGLAISHRIVENKQYLCNIEPASMKRYMTTVNLNCLRNPAREAILDPGHRLGCWVSAHQQGGRYTKVNLQNTDTSKIFKVLPSFEGTQAGANWFLHHMALVAEGRGHELLAASLIEGDAGDAEYQVSHLCHNGKCFNPAHLVVETGADNRSRNNCAGHVDLDIRDHTGQSTVAIVHQCPHGILARRMACLLPMEQISINAPNSNQSRWYRVGNARSDHGNRLMARGRANGSAVPAWATDGTLDLKPVGR